MTRKIGSFLLSFLLCCSLGKAQGFLKADGSRIVNGQNEEVILRGIGLGGWMLQEPYMLQLSGVVPTQGALRARISQLIGPEKTQAFYDAWLSNLCTKADVDSLAAWGFNSIRLPMHYNLFTLPVEQEPAPGQQTWLPRGFALTDSLLSWCKADHIYLILDLHATPGGQGNDVAIADRDTTRPALWQSEANRQKTIALWAKLAARYANEPWIGGYDIINEPNWGFADPKDEHGCAESGNAPLLQLFKDITKVIREADPQHLIFIEGNCWGNNYKGLLPLWDKNMVLSFHKYWNYNDPASIQGLLELRSQYNMPLWLGESGENSNTWSTDAIRLVEDNHIGWAWWPLKKAGFNNPGEVKLNDGFRRLIAYWKGQGAAPSPAETYSALMAQATAGHASQLVYHRDVIDAMFRQVHHTETLPFEQVTVKPGTIVYAVNYDLGRNGFAYWDTDTANYRSSTKQNTAGNTGGRYRNDGVDIGACKDQRTNGYYVGWIKNGEWLQYTVNAPQAGTYDVAVRVAAPSAGGRIAVSNNGLTTAGSIAVPATGQDQAWTTVPVKNVKLVKGENKIRLQFQGEGFNVSYLEFLALSK